MYKQCHETATIFAKIHREPPPPQSYSQKRLTVSKYKRITMFATTNTLLLLVVYASVASAQTFSVALWGDLVRKMIHGRLLP